MMPRYDEIVVRASVRSATTEGEPENETLVEENDDTELDAIDAEPAQEGLRKLWKKTKLWFTDGNKTAVEKIHANVAFLGEEATDADIAAAAEKIMVSFPKEADIQFMNAVSVEVLAASDVALKRVAKEASYLTVYKQAPSAAFHVPDCEVVAKILKKVGIEITYRFDDDYLAVANYKDYNKKFGPQKPVQLSKIGIRSMKDVQTLVKLVDDTDRFMANFYKGGRERHIAKQLPLFPKGLKISKPDEELARMNRLRVLAFSNASLEGLETLNEVLYMVRHITEKLRSKV